MKLIIIAGGGGHFAAALPVIKKLQEECEVTVFGRKHPLEGDSAISLEYKTCKSLGVPFESITTGRLQRKLTRFTVLSLFKIPIGFFQSLLLLIKYQPNAVLSFGGYISVPVCICAFILRIPIIIHEQTLEAGLANKIVSFFARKICISWKSSQNFFPADKTVVTGNPSITTFSLENTINDSGVFPLSQESLPLLTVLGGSSGSHAINMLIDKILEELLSHYKVILQTGDSQKFQDRIKIKSNIQKLPHKLKNRFQSVSFINPFMIGSVIKKSSLVISRAGINTVGQLIYFKVPSLLIPLTVSQNNEQFKNAQFLKETGLGEILVQEKLTPQILLESMHFMTKNLSDYSIKKNIDFPSHPEEEIIKILKDVVS